MMEEEKYCSIINNYYAPIQKVGDYLKNVKSTEIGKVKPTYEPGVTLSNLNELFPEYINETFKEAIINLNVFLAGPLSKYSESIYGQTFEK